MNFKEVLKQLKIPFVAEGHEHCRPGWVQLDCPGCGMYQHWRLGYNLSHHYMTCWLCGHKDVANVLCVLSGQSYGTVKALLGGIERERIKDNTDLRRGKLKVPGCLMPSLHYAHRKYLKGRGFDCESLVKLWDIKAFGPHGRFKWRIYIPIYHHGQIVSWTTRAIVDDGVRYISARPEEEILNHRTILYGADYCYNTAIIVEGPTDVWTIGPGTVASLGTGFTRAQVVQMAEYPNRVVCFDNEEAAQKRARQLCDQLEAFPGETYNVKLSGKDANSSPKEEVHELRRKFLGI